MKIGTHEMILAAFSPLFREILNKYQYPHPLVYMRGLKEKYLSTITIICLLWKG